MSRTSAAVFVSEREVTTCGRRSCTERQSRAKWVFYRAV